MWLSRLSWGPQNLSHFRAGVELVERHFLPPRRVKLNLKLGLFGYGNILMAAVGPTRQSRVSMSVSMSLVQGGAAGASATGTVLGMFALHRFATVS